MLELEATDKCKAWGRGAKQAFFFSWSSRTLRANPQILTSLVCFILQISSIKKHIFRNLFRYIFGNPFRNVFGNPFRTGVTKVVAWWLVHNKDDRNEMQGRIDRKPPQSLTSHQSYWFIGRLRLGTTKTLHYILCAFTCLQRFWQGENQSSSERHSIMSHIDVKSFQYI